MIEASNPVIPWAQRTRLRFIERHLLWKRSLVARALTDEFGISRYQAGKDIKLYQSLFPENVKPYSPEDKAYKPMSGFKPQLMDEALPAGLSSGLIEHVPLLGRKVENNALYAVLDAIDSQTVIEVVYGSNSMPTGCKRKIYPSRIIQTSNRLHFRGYCLLKKDYRDFVFSRCLTVPRLLPDKIKAPCDKLWNDTVTFKVGINPGLNEAAQQLVQYEYGDVLHEAVCLSKALLHYYLIDNNIPANKTQMKIAHEKPWAYPLLVELSSELEQLLFGQ